MEGGGFQSFQTDPRKGMPAGATTVTPFKNAATKFMEGKKSC